MKKFLNKYRIPSSRMQNYDYGGNGSYFITICTLNHVCYFGHVENENMNLSRIGSIAKKCREEIPVHFPFVQSSEFVIMPDHVHGIVIINRENIHDGQDPGVSVSRIVGTQNFASLQFHSKKNQFGPQTKNLASIIRGFKIGVTKNARIIDPEFK